MAKAAILELDDLTDREFINIKSAGGQAAQYELVRPEELDLVQENRLKRLSLRFAELGANVNDLTDEDAAEMARVVADLVAIVLLAPDEVRARLTDVQRVRIYQAFLQLTGQRTPASPAGDVAEAGQSTGESGSRA